MKEGRKISVYGNVVVVVVVVVIMFVLSKISALSFRSIPSFSFPVVVVVVVVVGRDSECGKDRFLMCVVVVVEACWLLAELTVTKMENRLEKMQQRETGICTMRSAYPSP